MKVISSSFADQSFMPSRYAFARIDPEKQVALAENLNPHLQWSDVPPSTRSFLVICHDPDAPSQADDVNQLDRTVAADLPRVNFIHWVLLDLEAERREIQEGEFSNGVTPRGKGGPLTQTQVRQGLNDYTNWFASDRDMSGEYYGYDGPCPPWNDERVHRYVFTVYALDVPAVPLDGVLTAAQVMEVIAPNILTEATITGFYTLNPTLNHSDSVRSQE